MHMRKFAAFAGLLVGLSGMALGDTLTFIAQPISGGGLDYDWFNSANWFASDSSGNLSPAGRVPLASDGAVIIGMVDAGSGGVRVQTLLATNNAVITNGTFAVLNLQMLSGSSFNNSTVNLLAAMTVGGTNCALNQTTLNIFGTAAGILKPVPPAPAATLILSQGSLLNDGGSLALTDGSQINGGGAPQSQFIVTSGAVLSSTNSTFLGGPATNHLIIDNSGLIRDDGGTLMFGDGIDWRSAAGGGEFQAASSNALILFTAPFHADSTVTDSFTGAGTNRWLAGAGLDGTAQVSGNLEILDSVGGAGTVHVLGNATPGGVLTWLNGTLSLPLITIDLGGNMLLSGGVGTSRQLAGCTVNNSGFCGLPSGDLSFSQGGAVNNLPGGLFDLEATGSVTLSITNGLGAINNSGVFRKSGGGVTQFGTLNSLQGPDFNNNGLLDLVSGQMNLLGGVSSGEFRTTNNTVLWFWGGTHTLNTGASFTGAGSVRLRQSAATAQWQVMGPITVSELELSSNGTVDGSGNSSGTPIHFGNLLASDNGTLRGGSFEAQDCQLLDQSSLTNCSLNILAALELNGTNCSLSGSTLSVSAGASATVDTLAPGLTATLHLAQGSVLLDNGLLAMADGAQITSSIPPQSRIVIAQGGVLSSTNLAYFQGSSTNHLVIDNGGLVRVDGGTLQFGDALDWKSSTGAGEFRAATPAAVVLFNGPFSTDSGVTNSFTGPGTNRWLAGATIAGTAQAGGVDAATQSALPGNLELVNSVTGSGTLQAVGNGSQSGVLTWINGTLGLAGMNIGAGGTLRIVSGPASSRHLSGCQVSNAGRCVWLSPDGILAGAGATWLNAPSGLLDFQNDTTLAFDNTPPMLALNNAGTLLKSAGTGATPLAADFKNSGSVQIQAGTLGFQGYWVQTVGSTVVSSGTVLSAGAVQILGGTLSGNGTIDADVTNACVVSPGPPLGILSLAAGKTYTQTPVGALAIQIAGYTPGTQFDQLVVGGNAALSGRLQVSFTGGFIAKPGDAFEILACGSQTGSFSAIDPPGIPGTSWIPLYNGTNLVLVLANAVTLPRPTVSGNSLTFSFPTTLGLTYLVQATDGFFPPNWQTIKRITGDGTVQTVSDPLAGPQRFYRLSLQ